ncbi:MAG: Arm DNA-binding domain-containing protein [Terracidiphilus sp.]|nr:Arm DNA-binding domain-containing protein [Terracidiphilus sp.]
MLTDTAVRKATVGDRPYNLTDQDGLFLWVNTTGGKLWRWKYRFDRAQKQMAFGKYPDVSLAQARELHAAARRLLASGVDPMAQRKAEKCTAQECKSGKGSAAIRTTKSRQRKFFMTCLPFLT